MVGQLVNETRAKIEESLEETKKKLEAAAHGGPAEAAEVIDVTLPAKKSRIRVTVIPTPSPWKRWSEFSSAWAMRWWKALRWSMTTTTLSKLNIPKGHPARDEQDTFYHQ